MEFSAAMIRAPASRIKQLQLTIIIQDVNHDSISTRYKWSWWCYIARNNKVLCPFQELVIPNIDSKSLDIAIISALVKCHICIEC